MNNVLIGYYKSLQSDYSQKEFAEEYKSEIVVLEEKIKTLEEEKLKIKNEILSMENIFPFKLHGIELVKQDVEEFTTKQCNLSIKKYLLKKMEIQYGHILDIFSGEVNPDGFKNNCERKIIFIISHNVLIVINEKNNNYLNRKKTMIVFSHDKNVKKKKLMECFDEVNIDVEEKDRFKKFEIIQDIIETEGNKFLIFIFLISQIIELKLNKIEDISGNIYQKGLTIFIQRIGDEILINSLIESLTKQ